MKVRFLPEADMELLHEVSYYSEAGTGAGVRFREAVMQAVAMAARFPLGGKPTYKETRRMRVKGFKFSVIYRVSKQEILIVAVAPDRKRPGYWQRRL